MMKRAADWLIVTCAAIAIAAAIAVCVDAYQERITLTTPITQPIATYRVRTLLLDAGPTDAVEDDATTIELEATGTQLPAMADNLRVRRFVYSGANAQLNQLNRANLTTRSLIQRIMDKLIADGQIAGTVTGIPQQ